jgi:hypothetical protein
MIIIMMITRNYRASGIFCTMSNYCGKMIVG